MHTHMYIPDMEWALDPSRPSGGCVHLFACLLNHAYVCICTRECMHVCVYVCMYGGCVHLYACLLNHAYVCICTRECVHVCVYVCMCMYT